MTLHRPAPRTALAGCLAVALAGCAGGPAGEDCTPRRIADLPMLENLAEGPVVSVAIGGRPHEMLIDTGGSSSLLDPSVARRFGVHAARVVGHLGLGAIPLDKVVRVPSVAIGRRTLHGVTFFDSPVGYPGVDGTLGLDLLRGIDVEIDPAARRVVFFGSAACGGDSDRGSDRDVAVVTLDPGRGRRGMTARAVLDGRPIRALLDTGTADTVLSLDAARRLFGLGPGSPGVLPGHPTIGPKRRDEPTWSYRFSALTMEGIVFERPWVTLARMTGDGPELIVGMHQLAGLHLYFASGDGKLYATRADAGSGTGAPRPSPRDRIRAEDEVRAAEGQIDLHDKAAAARSLDRALALDPGSAEAYVLRSALYADRGDGGRAMAAAERAIRLDPGLGVAYLERGELYGRARDWNRAFADADRAVRLLPGSAYALNARCWFGALLGRLDGALADCDRALALMPSDAEIRDSRAFVHLQAGRLDAAIRDYDAALAIDPRLASSLYGRGLAWRRSGDRAKGDADLAAALRADPKVALIFAQ